MSPLQPIARWYPHHKLALIRLVQSGACDLDEALRFHGIGRDEYERWVELRERAGLRGLRTCRRYAGGPVAAVPVPIAQALPPSRGRRVSRRRVRSEAVHV